MDPLKRRSENEEDVKSIKISQKDLEDSVEFMGIAANGIPGDKIVQYAQDNEFDHIVIGISRKGHIGEVLLGSVSYHIIHHTSVPVVIVK